MQCGSSVKSIISALPDAALIIDRAGLVMAANGQADAIFGFAASGLPVTAMIRAPGLLDAITAASGNGEAAHIAYEIRFPVPRWFEAHVAPLDPQAPGDPAILVVLRDLTREQRIERMRADFVANASHELRTPLASLSGFIETLQGAARNDEKSRDRFLGLMKEQARRMGRLIDDLLSLSRIEINEHVAPGGETDLVLITRHVADMLSGMAREMGCEIRLTLPASLPVKGDRDELVQVVQNLVENAIKYGGSGKAVLIEGSSADGVAEIAVQDYGPGIAEEHIPRLTERFYRVSVQDSRARGGTGLGLAIVKHILGRHRGRLVIQSAPGKGSRFAIRLPERK